MKIKELFNVSYGNVRSIKNYEKGDIPYVSSGLKNNGVLGLINTDEKLFPKKSITIASKGSIGSCFVQPFDFVASKDNVVVLQDRNDNLLTIEEKYVICAYINSLNWKYSYGRTLSKTRISNIDIDIDYKGISKLFNYDLIINKIIPKKENFEENYPNISYSNFKIEKLFDVRSGEGGYIKDFEFGVTPLISATSQNNGIATYVDSKPYFKAPAITVERVSGNAFIQLNDFITVPDDVSVLIPKFDVPLELLYYVASLINSKGWKYCYGRKLSKGRLKKIDLRLPVTNSENNIYSINYDYLENFFKLQYGWDYIKKY